MRQKIYSKDIILVLAASFFYMASPMLVTPLITGFTESIGASAALMGLVGGMMNLPYSAVRSRGIWRTGSVSINSLLQGLYL